MTEQNPRGETYPAWAIEKLAQATGKSFNEVVLALIAGKLKMEYEKILKGGQKKP